MMVRWWYQIIKKLKSRNDRFSRLTAIRFKYRLSFNLNLISYSIDKYRTTLQRGNKVNCNCAFFHIANKKTKKKAATLSFDGDGLTVRRVFRHV